MEPGSPRAVRVIVAEGSRGTPDTPLPFSLTGAPLAVDLEVVAQDGSIHAGFDGWLELTMEPGDVERVERTDGLGVIDNHVEVRSGVARGLTVYVDRAFSEARLWAEDIGYRPADPSTAACANGLDDDGDGVFDYPEDPGCRYANDDTEEPGSHAAGVSDRLFFANPGLDDVQGYQSETPLVGRRVDVTQGEMIVTRVTSGGFYVSEIEHDVMGRPTGNALPWAAVYVFNFSTPPYLRACDRITIVSGAVGEFFGFTELNFPSWERDIWCAPGRATCTLDDGRVLSERPCPIPEPFLLDDTVLGTPMMEQYEAHLVRVADLTLPSVFGPGLRGTDPTGSNCDLNGDGDVSLVNGSAEDDCNEECSADPACSEWNQFLEFGQYAVQTAGAVINVVSRETLPDFDPTAHRGESYGFLTGTLKNFGPLGPQRGWILEPRCEEDLVEAGGTPVPSSEACVNPRTGGPEEVM